MERVFSQAMKARQDLGVAKEGRVSQYIHASNHQAVYLRLTQCYMSVFYILLSQYSWGTKRRSRSSQQMGIEGGA